MVDVGHRAQVRRIRDERTREEALADAMDDACGAGVRPVGEDPSRCVLDDGGRRASDVAGRERSPELALHELCSAALYRDARAATHPYLTAGARSRNGKRDESDDPHGHSVDDLL